jgi:hypothetical protein
MRFKIAVSFGTWMMLVGAVASAQDKTVGPAVETAAQTAAAGALKQLGSQPGPRLAGMPARHLTGRAVLGTPFPVRMVRLDELQRYQRGSDPAALLHDLETAVFPIRVAGKVHGEMVMRKVSGVWSARGFAGPAYVQRLENLRGKVSSRAGVSAGSTMVVRVPALNIEFVAHRNVAGLQMTPLTDLPAAGLTAGQALPASRIFELLLPLAKEHNGLLS